MAAKQLHKHLSKSRPQQEVGKQKKKHFNDRLTSANKCSFVSNPDGVKIEYRSPDSNQWKMKFSSVRFSPHPQHLQRLNFGHQYFFIIYPLEKCHDWRNFSVKLFPSSDCFQGIVGNRWNQVDGNDIDKSKKKNTSFFCVWAPLYFPNSEKVFLHEYFNPSCLDRDEDGALCSFVALVVLNAISPECLECFLYMAGGFFLTWWLLRGLIFDRGNITLKFWWICGSSHSSWGQR